MDNFNKKVVDNLDVMFEIPTKTDTLKVFNNLVTRAILEYSPSAQSRAMRSDNKTLKPGYLIESLPENQRKALTNLTSDSIM